MQELAIKKLKLSEKSFFPLFFQFTGLLSRLPVEYCYRGRALFVG